MYQGIRISGFGGQGIVSAGVLLTCAGMIEGRHVTFFPAYGAEMRGGTANCSVVISSDEIASPVVTRADTVIVMNEPSLAMFEPMLKPEGVLIVNTSLVKLLPQRKDITVISIACTSLAADEAGNPKAANMVALGAFAEYTGAVSIDSIVAAMPKVYKQVTANLLEMDRRALECGARHAMQYQNRVMHRVAV